MSDAVSGTAAGRYRRQSTGSGPYLIAEIGVNHENSIESAQRMIAEVAAAGWDAAKFQTYKAERLASIDSPSYWDTTKEAAKSQYTLFKRFDRFERHDYVRLARTCQEHGIDFLSTPFDIECLPWLMPLMPAVKVASADITNAILLAAIARFEKPVILSTGAADLAEIQYAVDLLRRNGVSDLTLLHCVLRYPTEPERANLGRLSALAREFPECDVGYSDHVPPDGSMLPLVIATVLGATVVEKHFTLDKSLPGNDHYHAADPTDARIATTLLASALSLLGTGEIDSIADQLDARRFARRSLVTRTRLARGSILTEHDVIAKRPGTGISPVQMEDALGRTLINDVSADHVLLWEDLAEANETM